MSTVLRWGLGLASVIAGGAWLALAVLGGSFRASFGASPVDLVTRIGPVAVAGCVLASVVWPGQRALLHVTPAVVAVGCIGLLGVLRESVFVGTLGLAYCGAWLVFYARAL